MAELTVEQIDWVKSALGFDLSAALQQQGNADPNAGAKGQKAQKRSKDGDETPSTPTPTPTPTPTAPTAADPTDKGLVAALKGLDDAIKAVTDLGFDTKQMTADRADFAKSGVKAEAGSDEKAKKKAIAALIKRIEQATDHAKGLATATKKVMGDATGAPSASQKNDAYKKALEDQYGLKIKVPDGMTNTHFDRVFDMFGTVPKGDVKQSKLKKLTYSDKADDKGSGAYGSAEIEMGDFGNASKSEDYTLNGETIPANSFNVTTLHEIGHAVDDKHKVMKSNQSKPGCGGWKSEKLSSVAAAFVAELKGEVSDKVKPKQLTAVVSAALKDGTTEQPDGIEDADWAKILPVLTDKCLNIRSDADPWFESTQVVVGGRVYQEAYSGEWVSYDPGARASTKVNNYQWRSPAEWFAEIYAITWLAKKPPPGGVDKSAAEYMWKG